MYNSFLRESSDIPLTHKQLDYNFKMSENLKGYTAPEQSFGIVGDEYTIPEHYRIDKDTMNFMLEPFNDLYVYSYNFLDFGYKGHVLNNLDCNFVKVDSNNRDTLIISFEDNTPYIGKHLEIKINDVIYNNELILIDDVFTLDILNIYDYVVRVMNISFLIDINIINSTELINYQKYIKYLDGWKVVNSDVSQLTTTYIYNELEQSTYNINTLNNITVFYEGILVNQNEYTIIKDTISTLIFNTPRPENSTCSFQYIG